MRNKYSEKLKRDVVNEYFQGEKPRVLNKKYGLTNNILYGWVAKARKDKEKSNGKIAPGEWAEQAYGRGNVSVMVSPRQPKVDIQNLLDQYKEAITNLNIVETNLVRVLDKMQKGGQV